AIEIVSVNDIKFVRRHGLADVLDLALRQWKKIWIAAHEGKPFAVLGDGQNISRANDAAAARSSRPVNDGAARKVPAAADQSDAIPKLKRATLPQLDRRPFPHDPFLIGGMEMDRAAESLRPFIHRRVEMRVRDRDRFQAPEALDETHCRGIERRNAVPEQVAALRLHQQRALPDGETSADTDDAGIVFVERVHVALLKRRQRRPGLAARRHVLPLLLADWALGGRLRAFRILRAAGGADEERHGHIPLLPTTRIVLV